MFYKNVKASDLAELIRAKDWEVNESMYADEGGAPSAEDFMAETRAEILDNLGATEDEEISEHQMGLLSQEGIHPNEADDFSVNDPTLPGASAPSL